MSSNREQPLSDETSIIDHMTTSPRIAGPTFPKRDRASRTADERKASVRKTKKSAGPDKAGPDGTTIQARRLHTGTQAIATIKVRCRPGTFEWRYGRHGNTLYHAGSEFARLWERAGIAFSGSSTGGESGGGGWKGMPDARVVAVDRVKQISVDLGGPIVRRLVAYCVEGRTPREIADTYRKQATERQMAIVLEQDLTDLARAMNFAA